MHEKKPAFLSDPCDRSAWVTNRGLNPRTNAYTKYYIAMVTINPDPRRMEYQDQSEDCQKARIVTVLNEMQKKFPFIKIPEGVFEYTKNHLIHWHGVFAFFVTESRMNSTAIKVGKYVHSHLGRKHCKWWTCCFIDSNDSLEKWLKYIRKEVVDYYPCPISFSQFRKSGIVERARESDRESPDLVSIPDEEARGQAPRANDFYSDSE